MAKTRWIIITNTEQYRQLIDRIGGNSDCLNSLYRFKYNKKKSTIKIRGIIFKVKVSFVGLKEDEGWFEIKKSCGHTIWLERITDFSFLEVTEG